VHAHHNADEEDVRGEEGRTLAKERFAAKDPISLSSECRAWRVLAAACEARLASLPTTAEQVEMIPTHSQSRDLSDDFTGHVWPCFFTCQSAFRELSGRVSLLVRVLFVNCLAVFRYLSECFS